VVVRLKVHFIPVPYLRSSDLGTLASTKECNQHANARRQLSGPACDFDGNVAELLRIFRYLRFLVVSSNAYMALASDFGR
jgi:hypothetical protein